MTAYEIVVNLKSLDHFNKTGVTYHWAKYLLPEYVEMIVPKMHEAVKAAIEALMPEAIRQGYPTDEEVDIATRAWEAENASTPGILSPSD